MLFTHSPGNVTQAIGLLADFECENPYAVTTLTWLVNGLPVTDANLTIRSRCIRGNDGQSSCRMTIPATESFNNSQIQCSGFTLSGNVKSQPGTLLVQGKHKFTVPKGDHDSTGC